MTLNRLSTGDSSPSGLNMIPVSLLMASESAKNDISTESRMRTMTLTAATLSFGGLRFPLLSNDARLETEMQAEGLEG